jgi:hypothetical protein
MAKFRVDTGDKDTIVTLRLYVNSSGNAVLEESTHGLNLLFVTPEGVVEMCPCMDELVWVKNTQVKKDEHYLKVNY